MIRLSVFRVMLLLVPAASAFATTRSWKFDLDGEVTRCFQAKNIRVICEGEPDEVTKLPVEELQIEAKDLMGGRFSYGYSKMIEGPLCQEHLKKIRRILKKADQACITGEAEMKLVDGETHAKWSGFETRFGEVRW